VVADHIAMVVFDLARLGGQVLLKKILEAALADKADPGGILLLVVGKALFFGDATHFRFFQIPQREQGALELVVIHGVEEVGLVLIGIHGPQQAPLTVVAHLGIVAGSNIVRAQGDSVVQKRLEFDFLVAEDVRVGGATGLVFSQKMFEYPVPVLSSKIGGM